MGWSAHSAIAADAARSVAVLEFGSAYGLGFVASHSGKAGQLVTALSVVAGERTVRAVMSDGRHFEVPKASGVDLRRDLAVLASAMPNQRALSLDHTRMVEDGTEVLAFSYSTEAHRLRWVRGTVDSVQVLGGALTVYQLKGDFPPDTPGSPLIGPGGECLGVFTLAQTEKGLTSLGIPTRYLPELMAANQALPLSTLSPRQAKREVPQHNLNLLEGSTPRGLEKIVVAIASAIRLGAPAYNQGDAAACYQVYVETARRLVQQRSDCPGPRQALVSGLQRAEGLNDIDSQAWAMRDTFDGLLSVIERFFRTAEPPGAKSSRKPELPN